MEISSKDLLTFSLIIFFIVINIALGCIAPAIDEHKKKKNKGDKAALFIDTLVEFYKMTLECMKGGQEKEVTHNGKVLGKIKTQKDYSMFIYLFITSFAGAWFFLNSVLGTAKAHNK